MPTESDGFHVVPGHEKKDKGHRQKAAHAGMRALDSKNSATPAKGLNQAGSAIKHLIKGPLRKPFSLLTPKDTAGGNPGQRKAWKAKTTSFCTTDNAVSSSTCLTNRGAKTKALKSSPFGIGVTVSHTEELFDVIGASGFHSYNVPLNVGLANVFPWLSTFTANYETYRFSRLRLFYVTKVATTAEGTVVIAFEYDPADTDRLDEKGIVNHVGSVTFPPYVGDQPSIFFDGRRVSPSSPKYIRSEERAGSPAIYDAARFLLGVGGVDAAHDQKVIGKIFAEYVVELYNPNSAPRPEVTGNTVTQIHAEQSTVGVGSTAMGPFKYEVVGTEEINPLRLYFVPGTTDTQWTLPSGRYIFEFNITPYNMTAGSNNIWIVSFLVNGTLAYTHTQAQYAATAVTAFGNSVYASTSIILKYSDVMRLNLSVSAGSSAYHATVTATLVS